MLQFQLAQSQFRFGLAEGVDPHQVPMGTLMTAENCVWRKNGRIEKRLGATGLTRSILGGGSVSAAARLFTRGSELCLIDGTSLYSYSVLAAAWKLVDTVPDVGLTWKTILDAYAGAAYSDVAVSSTGLVVHAWVTGDPTASTSGALCVQVQELDSGVKLVAPTVLSASGNIQLRVLIIGTTAIVLTRNAANIVAYTVNLSTMAVSAGTNLRTDALTAGSGSGLDACVIGTNFVVLYSQAANTVVVSYNSSLVQQVAPTVAEASLSTASSVDGRSGEVLYVTYLNGAGNIRIAIHNSATLAQTVAPATVAGVVGTGGLFQLGVARYDATHSVIAYTTLNSSGQSSTLQYTSGGALVANSGRTTWGTRWGSRPFTLGSKCYAFLLDYPVGTTEKYPGTNMMLVEVEVSATATATVPHRLVGKSEVLVAGTVANNNLPNVVVTPTSTRLVTSLLFLASAAQGVTNWRCGARLVSVTIGASLPADMWRSVQFAGEAYFCGGVLGVYDGRNVFDYGFARAPVAFSLTASGAGGAMVAGTYLYGKTLEYRSAAGILHRGPTSTSSVTVGGATTGSVAGVFVGCNIGLKEDLATGFGTATPCQILMPLYRTVVGGSTYYRETYEPGFNMVTVDPTSRTQLLTDTRADASIDGAGTALSTRPELYTTGGILDDYQPPAFTTCALWKLRIFGIDGSGQQGWFSKSFIDDLGVAPGFNPAFRFAFDQPVTGLLAMDEKLLVFWQRGLWFFQGADQGPTPDGNGSDILGPIPVQSDVGCSSPRSLVSMPDGVAFLGERGLYLCTRGLELVWFGRSVQDELAAYPNVTSAVLVATRNEIRFTANNAAGTAGIVLVFNYIEKQWSTSKYTVNGVYGAPIADACLWNGVWTFVTPAGFVMSEDPTTYLDGGATFVPMTIETAWISAAGPLAFQSVRTFQLEGISSTNHDLTISVGFDSDPSYPQTKTFAAASPVTSIGPLEQCEITIGTRRKCQHIRFKIQDATPTGGPAVSTGQGPSFDTMGLEIGIKKGFARNPATKKG